eukprot:gene30930-35986_t
MPAARSGPEGARLPCPPRAALQPRSRQLTTPPMAIDFPHSAQSDPIVSQVVLKLLASTGFPSDLPPGLTQFELRNRQNPKFQPESSDPDIGTATSSYPCIRSQACIATFDARKVVYCYALVGEFRPGARHLRVGPGPLNWGIITPLLALVSVLAVLWYGFVGTPITVVLPSTAEAGEVAQYNSAGGSGATVDNTGTKDGSGATGITPREGESDLPWKSDISALKRLMKEALADILNMKEKVEGMLTVEEVEDTIIPVEGAGVVPRVKRIAPGLKYRSKTQLSGTVDYGAQLAWSQSNYAGNPLPSDMGPKIGTPQTHSRSSAATLQLHPESKSAGDTAADMAQK